SDGVLQIRAQDPLYLAGFKHAMIPRPSEIQLYKDLPADQYGTMSAQEWAEYGFDQIPTPDADNRAYFTLGDDLAWINPETKGVYRKPEHQGGRSPSDQSAGTTIQRAYNPTGRELALTPKTIRIDDLLKDILLNYTDISKLGAGIINNPQWSSFLGRYPWLERSYNFIITEPQPVLDTLSQIAEQTLFFVYWDERTASIHLGASLAATADFLPQLPLLDEFANFLQGSLDIKKVSNSVHTRIYINHSVLGWTDEYDKDQNYKAVHVELNIDEEADERRRVGSIQKINGYMLDGTLAADLANKLKALHHDDFYELKFDVDAKDNEFTLGDFFKFKSRLITDDAGHEIVMPAQVTSVSENPETATWTYHAIAAPIGEAGTGRPTVWPLEIQTDVNNVKIASLFAAAYPTYTPEAGDEIVVTVWGGVTVGSVDTFIHAMDYNLPQEYINAGVKATLVLRAGALIAGKGGAGGAGGNAHYSERGDKSLYAGANGRGGGTALITRHSLVIDNSGV